MRYLLTSCFFIMFSVSALSATQTAIFAGGCFWCVEADFDKVPGVTATVSGYTGGHLANPTYRQVSAGGTGHYEAVQVSYDDKKVSYQQLLEYFWKHIDPYNPRGQFCDNGQSYRAVIFYNNADEQRLANASKADLQKRNPQPIATQILPAQTFYPAEDYHQNYYQKNPLRYKYYRYRCGRDQRLKTLWGH